MSIDLVPVLHLVYPVCTSHS